MKKRSKVGAVLVDAGNDALQRRATVKASGRLKIVVMSHSHPAISKGGAEIAAYQHFSMLKEMGHEAVFIASGSGRVMPRDGVVFNQSFAENEYLYSGNQFDHFIHGNLDAAYPEKFVALLQELKPDVIHLHHYTNFGVETLLHIRRALPDCKIVITLHEYLAICHHMGQMVKTKGFRLCDASGYHDCAKCFPEKSEQDFFLRDHYIKRFFSLVDHFVSPSEFLRSRYVAWGLPGEKISVVENGLPLEAANGAPQREIYSEPELRIGFFGQISVLKGINVVIDAAKYIENLNQDSKTKVNIRFCVFGDYTGQPPVFKERFENDLQAAPSSTFTFMGPYSNSAVQKLMSSVDAVLVPSIWWENSPLVIQEAFRARRPVICSDIGGMAEKVRDGLDGFHFQAGSAASLCAVLQSIVVNPDKIRSIARTQQQPPSIGGTVTMLVQIYEGLMLDLGQNIAERGV
jgi:glycosyltransferase involved in cell wall biosynthesis